jgi:hypothetical protein
MFESRTEIDLNFGREIGMLLKANGLNHIIMEMDL